MRISKLLASWALVALSCRNTYRHKVWAVSVEEILKQCDDMGMAAENCKALMDGNGHISDIAIVSALQTTDNDAPDMYYYQVDLFVDYRGYILGRSPEFNGIVVYPYEWRGDTRHQYPKGTRSVGPWDCKGLTDIHCCAKIETDVPDPDINGNYLSCFMQEANYQDPVSGDLFGVYINSVDNSINYLTAEDLTNLEQREAVQRSDLIALIDDTVANKNCPKSTLQNIHAFFLHTMRGVPEARLYPKYTKGAIRNMNEVKIPFLDITADSDLQFALPLMKGVVEAVSKVGGLHPLTDSGDGYVVLQEEETKVNVRIVGRLRGAADPTKEPDDLVKCVTTNADPLNACADLLQGVKVITVHPRSITDTFYNQVVVPIDYRGMVTGSQPEYDGKITYKFEWRGNQLDGLGVRRVGPWDCKGLTDVQCCEMIQTSVPDLDSEGNYLDCWFSESFYNDPFTKKMSKVFYNSSTGTVQYHPSNEDVLSYQFLEEKARAKLINEIDNVLKTTDCPKQTLWKIYGDIRHAVRENAEVQGDPQVIRDVLQSQLETIDVSRNVFLQTVLQKIIQILAVTNVQNVSQNENMLMVVVYQNSTKVNPSRVGRFGGAS